MSIKMSILATILLMVLACSGLFVFSHSHDQNSANSGEQASVEPEPVDYAGRTYEQRLQEEQQERVSERAQSLKASCEEATLLYQKASPAPTRLSQAELAEEYRQAQKDEQEAKDLAKKPGRDVISLIRNEEALGAYVRVAQQDSTALADVIRIWNLLVRRDHPGNRGRDTAEEIARYAIQLGRAYPLDHQVQRMLRQIQGRLVTAFRNEHFDPRLRWTLQAILARNGGKYPDFDHDPFGCSTSNYDRVEQMLQLVELRKNNRSIRLWKRVWADVIRLNVGCEGGGTTPHPDLSYSLYLGLGMKTDARRAAYEMGQKFLTVYLDGLRTGDSGERYCPVLQKRFGDPSRDWFAKAGRKPAQTEAIIKKAALALAKDSEKFHPQDALVLYRQVLHDDDSAQRMENRLKSGR